MFWRIIRNPKNKSLCDIKINCNQLMSNGVEKTNCPVRMIRTPQLLKLDKKARIENE